MRVTVTRVLNARFINLGAAQFVQIQSNQVAVDLAARSADGNAFGSVTLSGTTDVGPGAPAPEAPNHAARGYPGVLIGDGGAPAESGVTEAVAAVECALDDMARLLRWRFNIAGDEQALGERHVYIDSESGTTELQSIPSALFGDHQSAIPADGLSAIGILSGAGQSEPLAHELLREAWDLKYGNPRSALVLGVV